MAASPWRTAAAWTCTCTRRSTKPISNRGQQCVHDILFLKLSPSPESQMSFFEKALCGYMVSGSLLKHAIDMLKMNWKKILLPREKGVNITSKLKMHHEEHTLWLGIMQIPLAVDRWTRRLVTSGFMKKHLIVGMSVAARRVSFKGGSK